MNSPDAEKGATPTGEGQDLPHIFSGPSPEFENQADPGREPRQRQSRLTLLRGLQDRPEYALNPNSSLHRMQIACFHCGIR